MRRFKHKQIDAGKPVCKFAGFGDVSPNYIRCGHATGKGTQAAGVGYRSGQFGRVRAASHRRSYDWILNAEKFREQSFQVPRRDFLPVSGNFANPRARDNSLRAGRLESLQFRSLTCMVLAIPQPKWRPGAGRERLCTCTRLFAIRWIGKVFSVWCRTLRLIILCASTFAFAVPISVKQEDSCARRGKTVCSRSSV